MKIKNKFISAIKEYNMIESGDNIVLGLSGGVDSMALLYLLLEIQDEYKFDLHIAHLNHGVRGEDAKKDQDFVKRIAEDLEIPFYTSNVDMDAYAKEHRITSEEAGRILRYNFFNSIVDDLGHGKIAVAHNLDDQAETLIMRFLRGTGIDGLRGIEFRNENIIRPILAISREELEAYIKEEGIEITQDKTNFQSIYTRNKIRLELMPYIKEHFNPNIVKTLERTARLAEIDSDFLEKHSKDRYNSIVKKESNNQVIMDLDLFLREDQSIKQRLIRLSILRLNNDLQGISEMHVTSILEIFESGETGKKVNISNDILARVRYDDLIIEKNMKRKSLDFNYPLEDKVFIEEIGLELELKLIENKKFKDLPKKRNSRYFDFEKISGKLYVRNRKPGDSFQPFGMKGNKKIKDYFIDEKIAREDREKIPLIVDDEEIIWVVGYRTSNRYRISKDSKKILEISYSYKK